MADLSCRLDLRHWCDSRVDLWHWCDSRVDVWHWCDSRVDVWHWCDSRVDLWCWCDSRVDLWHWCDSRVDVWHWCDSCYKLWHCRLFHEELCRRLGTDSKLRLSGSSDSLTVALRESLSLDDNFADRTNASVPDLSSLSLQDIIRKLVQYREELGGSVSLSLVNSDKLLDREIKFPPNNIDQFSW